MAIIEYLVDGKPMTVDPENEKAFLEAMKGKKIEKVSKDNNDKEESGKQEALLGDATVEQNSNASNQETSQSQNNQQKNTESKSEDSSLVEYIHDGKKYTVDPGNEKQFEKAHKGAVKVTEQPSSEDNRLPENFVEPTQEKWDEVRDSSWFNKETALVDWLNNESAYKDTNVEFSEAQVGRDFIEVKVGDESKQFDVHGYQSFDKIKNYIKTKSSKDYENKMLEEIASNFVTEDMALLDTDWNEDNLVDFATQLDEKSGQIYFPKPEPNQFGTTRSRTTGAGMSALGGILNLFELAQAREADMDGQITLSDGSKVDYQYIWDNRQKIRDLYKKQRNKISRATEEERRLNEGKGATGSEALKNHALMNMNDYFNLVDEEDVEIANITDTIGKINLGIGEYANMSDKEKEDLIESLDNQKMAIIKEKGYDHMKLYDDDGSFIGVKKEDWIIDGDFMIHPTTGMKIPILGDDEVSSELAKTDIETLEEEFINKYIELLEWGKIAHGNMERMGDARNDLRGFLTDLVDTDKNSWDNDKRQLARLIESGDIFNLGGDGEDLSFLTKLPSDTHIGKEFNKALDEFVNYGRAIKLNINPTKGLQESWGNELLDDLQDGIAGDDFKTTQGRDKGVEVFENFFTTKGYELPDYEDDFYVNSGYGADELGGFGWSRTRGTWLRQRADAASDGAGTLAPILIAIAGFNKATGFKNLAKKIPSIAKKYGKTAAGKYGITAGLTGTFTVAEWAAAEHMGQVLLGSDGGDAWKAHTMYYDREEQKWHLNAAFPFFMGVGGTTWKALSTATHRSLLNSRYGWGYSLAHNYTPSTIKGGFNKVVGEPLTATSLLTFASNAELMIKKYQAGYWPFEGVDEDSEEGRALKEELDLANPASEVGFNAFVDTYLLMAGVGLSKFRGNAKGFIKNAERDILAFKDTTPRWKEASTTNNMKENRRGKNGAFGEKYIEQQSSKEQKKIDSEIEKIEAENKKLQDKRKNPDRKVKLEDGTEGSVAEKLGENQTRIEQLLSNKKKVQQAAYTLKAERKFKIAKAKAKNRKEFGEYLQKLYIEGDLLLKLRTGNLTAEEKERIGELKPEMVDLLFDKAGIDFNSPEGKYYRWVAEETSRMVNILDRGGVTRGSKVREVFIDNSLKQIQNQWQIKSLEESSKENPDKKAENSKKIKELKAKNKELAEQIKASYKKFEIDFSKTMDAELAQSRIEAKKLGFKLKVYGTKRYEKALKETNNYEKGKDSHGFVVGNNIYIHRKRAIAARNLGVGMHEVVHALLKDTFKEVVSATHKGKKYSKADLDKLSKNNRDLYEKILEEGDVLKEMSKDGIKVIDKMLSKLSEKELEIVQERIDKEYRYDEKGNELAKKEYYEEYITVLGDAMKNKLISRDYGLGRKLSRIFYPMIKPFFPELYKFDINQTKGKKAVKDLFDMIQEIQSDGLTKDVLDAVKKDNSKATFATSKGMMENLDIFTSKTIDVGKGKEMLDIGLDGKTKRKYKDNIEFLADVENYTKLWEVFNTPPDLYKSKRDRQNLDPKVLKAIETLDNIIMGPEAVKRYVESGSNNYNRETFIEAVKMNLDKRFRKYDYDKNPSIFGWLYSDTGQGLKVIDRARGDVGMAKGGREQVKTVSYDAKMAGGEKTFSDTFGAKDKSISRIESEDILGGSIDSKATSNLRKRIGLQRNSGFVKSTLSTLENVYKKGIELGDISSPKFKGIVQQHMIEKLRKPTQDIMGRGVGAEYQSFLLNGSTFKGIFDSLTPNELQSFEKQAESKGGKRILTELDYNTGDTGKINALIKSKLLPVTAIDKAAQSVNVYKKKPLKFNENGTMPAELRKDIEALFIKINSDVALERLGYKLSQNTPNTRKEGLAKKIVARFAEDATAEVLHSLKKKGEIPEFLHQESLSDALAVIHRQMNSIPIEAGGAMFAKGKYSESKVLSKLIQEAIGKEKDFSKFLKKEGILELMYENMELYDIIEKHVEAIYGPVEFTDVGFISKTKSLAPKFFKDLPDNFWRFRKVSKKGGVKTKTFDKKTMKEHETFVKGVMDFIPKEIALREGNLRVTEQILKNALWKLQSDRSPLGDGSLASRKRLNKEYDKVVKNMGLKMTPHTAKLWREATKVIENLDLAESTVKSPGTINRAIQDIQNNFHKLNRGEKIGAATTAFNPKSIDAAKKFHKAYMSSMQDWVNHMENSKTWSRDKAAKHVFIDFYTNSNFTKGTRMLAPITMMYVGKIAGKVKGEHMKDRSNVDAELFKSIYEGTLLKDFDGIMEGYEQAIGPKEVFDIIDNLGGRNNPNKSYRLMLEPSIAKDMIDLATGKDMHTLLTERYAIDLVKMELKARDRSEAVVNTTKAKNQIASFSKGGKKRGMSTFDFDDTLAKTKSGVRTTIPSTDGLPKPGRKVIFLAGGAGSGKSNVVKKLGLEDYGFKIVNSDISLEWLKKNSGLPENMNNLTKEQRSTLGKLQHQARGIARRKMMKYQGKADGVVVDGTGGSVKSMEKLVTEFKDKGYDVSMLFVETSLETAMARNRARKERSLLDVIVRKNHEAVQKNKPTFKDMFGETFMEVKTDNLKIDSKMPLELVAKMEHFVKSYEKIRLDAEQFAIQGDAILKKGGKFDFSEFNKVVEGEQGPLFGKAIERAGKYGTKDMFVLTARPAESAKAIHEFLKSQGLNIPLENITGLANSTGEAKARWMLEKFAEGYNDMYFADDALQNVKAVKDVLKQLDVKSKVVQAKAKFSKDIDRSMNEIIERISKGKISAGKEMSVAEAKIIGKGKGRFDYFVPPSAEDLKGLMYKLLGKGRQGDADMKFFKEALFDPFARGIRDLTITKQKMADEYKALKKKTKDIKLNEIIEGTPYTVDAAVRMYLWNKAGYEVPGISKAEQRQLVDYVNSRPNLVSFAETLSSISRIKEGYEKPGDYWMLEQIGSDLNNITQNRARKDFLHEWIENKNILFSEKNLNKLEAQFGPSYREALENMLLRMEKGTNRLHGIKDGPTKLWYDWINGSVGATMFWNTRSAVLQTISMVNFTNYAENNIFAQAKAFANQKQYWKDFAFIMNSPMLKQRRAGLEIDVSASELSNQFAKSGRNPQSIIKYLLEKGFTPTRIADSFAIAMGGAGYYRNRVNMYLKQGLSKAKANEKAWLDFQERAEETQQSSRPDLISQQQAGPLGRLILAWQNTPMQMTRLMKKSLSDIVNRRRIPGQGQFSSDIANLSRIGYYGAMQNLWFYTLQSGLMWLMFGSDREEAIEKKEGMILNGSLDTLLRGTGIYGAAVSTLKNVILQYNKEKNNPGWKQDMGNVVIEALNLSPPIGSKARKGYSAIKSWNKFDAKGVGKELGWRIENPELHATANVIEALTNIPVARTVNKANNLEEVMSSNNEIWQRVAMLLGWSRWNVGVKDEELEEAKARAKETRSERNKEKKEQEKKDKGLKQVRCSGTRSNGTRCGNTTWTKEKSWKCAHHMAFKDGMDRDGDGIKEYQCKATTSSGRRCRNKTENKNKRCYAHQ